MSYQMLTLTVVADDQRVEVQLEGLKETLDTSETQNHMAAMADKNRSSSLPMNCAGMTAYMQTGNKVIEINRVMGGNHMLTVHRTAAI